MMGGKTDPGLERKAEEMQAKGVRIAKKMARGLGSLGADWDIMPPHDTLFSSILTQ